MLDVWGDPVQVKTTPAGNKVRVALGTAYGREQFGRDGVWEMRVTDPDDDLSWVHCCTVDPDHEDVDLAVMRSHPEPFWVEAEEVLMARYDEDMSAVDARQQEE